jgi:hypothetical protein
MEKLCIAIAWRLPRRLVYWCAIRLGAHATTGRHEATVTPSLLFTEALKRWGEADDRP